MRTALYSHFDAEGVCLYIGISKRPVERLAEHLKAGRWPVASVDLRWFDTRAEAEAAERAAIELQSPIHNIRRDTGPLPVPPADGWRGRLADAVGKSGMSKRAISTKSDLGKGYVHSILIEGKDPTLENFLALCRTLEVDPAEIIGAA